MTTSRSDEPTIGAFIRSEVPDKGDKALVQYDGDVYEVENMGVFPPITQPTD